jgi:hypothetical protein
MSRALPKVFALAATEAELKVLEEILRRVGGAPEGPRAHASNLLDRVLAELHSAHQRGEIKQRWDKNVVAEGGITLSKGA